MVEQGLSVPPGLKRGGYTRISTGRSIPTRGKPTGPGPAGPIRLVAVAAGEDPPAPRPVHKRNDSGCDSDGEYGQPRTKRAKTRSKVKAHTPTPSTSESEEEISDSGTSSEERERSRGSHGQSSAGGYAQGGVESLGEDTVAGGAGFFNLARNDPSMVDIAQNPSKSLIVKLPANKAVKPDGPTFGKNDLNDLATVASGLSSYAGTSTVGPYPAFHPSMQNHHYPSDANHAHNTSGFPSAGYGTIDGLPYNSPYGSMMNQTHGSYPNGYDHFAVPRTPASSHFHDARGTSNAMSHPPSSLTQLSTSFVPEPAGQNDLMGGDHHSSGMSTASIFPEEFGHIPWQTRDVSTTGQTNGMDLDDMNTVQPSDIDPFHQQYDGYGDDGFGDDGFGDDGFGDGGYGDGDVYF